MSNFPDMSGAFGIDAPAKTNLWLRVVGKRDDGFHEIETRMVALSLSDTLKLKWREDDQVVLRCSDDTLPTGEENLVVKAVRALEARVGKTLAVSIDLEKHIPSGAGLGGGSSDAAAVLRALNEMAALHLSEEALAEVGATIGSDVPFFVYNRPCDCSGRGEIVTPVTEMLPSLNLFLLKPAFEIAASWAYQHWEKSGEYEGFSYALQRLDWGEMTNDLERPVFEKFPVLGEIKSWLCAQEGVNGALLSGSGSTMLAILDEGTDGRALESLALERYGGNCWTNLCRTA
ncbi:MAG: 4-(cytidine 5'-diphospho)-2-C-methyl-D-erythritol kinase [Verrucomicrobiales bacterium]|nr:4-(cytidine 5'-diphospho)-2-C-methyl-D-erythritol kinase [Verrucomicrobiales bacterium]